MDYDVFICHASEDKNEFVRPLAQALRNSGLKVWYDEFSLKLGDSLRKSIDRGLASSRYGVVVLSPSFFENHWPQEELNGLAQKEVGGAKVILPIWHKVGREDVFKYSPMLADRLAASSSDGVEAVARKILDVVQPGSEPLPEVQPNYKHRIPVNYQGQIAVRLGNIVQIKRWFGPEGPGGSGKLRVCTMSDLTDKTEYTSDIANTMMTIVPVDVTIQGRVADPMQRSGNSMDFSLEMTDEEFAKFYANREVRQSPLVG